MSPPLWLDDCICVPASVRVDRSSLCFLYGSVTFGKYTWRFTATDLFDPVREFHVTLTRVGGPCWYDAISLPRDAFPNAFVERRAITRILAEILALAFGRTESALNDHEMRSLYLESDLLDALHTVVATTVWVHPQFLAKHHP